MRCEGCVQRRERAMELDNFFTDTHPPWLVLTRLRLAVVCFQYTMPKQQIKVWYAYRL